MNRSVVIAVVVVGLVAASQVGASTKVATLVDDQDINEIANEVCDNDDTFKRQISRISTIQSLAAHFNGASGDAKLASCKSKFGQSIEALNSVISSPYDLCSQQKIAKLEQYHRDYVSTVSKFKDARKETGRAAPQMVKVFFMQYASQVSTLCSEVATTMLKESSAQPDDREWMKKLSSELGGLEQELASLKSYDDIFLIWNLMASLPNSMSVSINKYVQHDKPTKVTVEASDVENMHKLQEACKNIARPFYSIALQPVIRLVDIGYYPESNTLLNQLQVDHFSRIIYSMSMLCENFLPIRFVENKSLPVGKTAMVETSQATIKYGSPMEQVDDGNQVTAKTEALPDNIITVSENGAYALSKRIKAQVKSRGKIMKQMIKRIISTIKKSPASTLNALIAGESDVPVEEYVAKVKEEEIPDINDDETEVAAPRQRRSIKSILLSPFHALGYLGVGILYFLLIYFPDKILFPAIFGIFVGVYYLIFEPLGYVISKIASIGKKPDED